MIRTSLAAPGSRLSLLGRIIVLGVVLSGGSVSAEVLGDIVMDRLSSANFQPAVIFPHWKHRLRFKCYACHPDVFEMRAGANDVSMDALRAGEFCGRCHDGRTAFSIGFNTCRDWHSSEAQ